MTPDEVNRRYAWGSELYACELKADWTVTDEPGLNAFVWRGKGPRDKHGNRRVAERAFSYLELREARNPEGMVRGAVLRMDAELCPGPKPCKPKPFRPGRKRVRLALHLAGCPLVWRLRGKEPELGPAPPAWLRLFDDQHV